MHLCGTENNGTTYQTLLINMNNGERVKICKDKLVLTKISSNVEDRFFEIRSIKCDGKIVENLNWGIKLRGEGPFANMHCCLPCQEAFNKSYLRKQIDIVLVYKLGIYYLMVTLYIIINNDVLHGLNNWCRAIFILFELNLV